ncbi:hypothetical protein Nepgr_012736 [Nepenthes gracilis]|uniref:Uncharacterized protein n=1 Tax=Nepenthes gracilis TaxID=150966 RepID=A0AAD3SGA6_NEPGR|nr:hypothetical protein Nepgr_012736 [Nepenthes gracilis]
MVTGFRFRQREREGAGGGNFGEGRVFNAFVVYGAETLPFSAKPKSTPKFGSVFAARRRAVLVGSYFNYRGVTLIGKPLKRLKNKEGDLGHKLGIFLGFERQLPSSTRLYFPSRKFSWWLLHN